MKKYLFLFFFLITFSAFATDKWFKAGANTNINTLGNWWLNSTWTTPASELPRTSDSCFWISGAGNCVVNAAFSSYSTNFTGWNGTLTGNGAWNCAGQITLGSGGTYSSCQTVITFSSTTTGWKLYFAGKSTYFGLTFHGSGGGWKLVDNFSTGNTTIAVEQGTFDLNGYTTTSTYFRCIGTLTRTLTIGSGIIYCGATTGGGTGCSFTSTGLTLTSYTGVIWCGASCGFDGGGVTFCRVQFTSNRAGLITPIDGANTYSDLIMINPSNSGFLFKQDQVVIDTFKIVGSSRANRYTIKGDKGSGHVNFTAGTYVINYCDFQNIHTDDALNLSTLDVGNCGGNINITFPTPIKRFAKLASYSTQYWSSTSNWSTTSGGSTGASIPIPGDTAVFDALTLSADGKTFIGDIGTYPPIDFSSLDQNMIWNAGYFVAPYSFISSSRVTFQGSYLWCTPSVNDAYYDLKDCPYNTSVSVISTDCYAHLSGINTSWSIGVYGGCYLSGNITVGSFVASSYNYSNDVHLYFTSCLFTNTGAASSFNIVNDVTVDYGTSTIFLTGLTTTNPCTYLNLGKSPAILNKLYITPASVPTKGWGFPTNITVTIDTLFCNPGTQLLFRGGLTYTINYPLVSGNVTNKTLFNVSSGTTKAIISCPLSRICLEYMNMDYITGSGGSWYAGNSTDGGHNSGISFSTCPNNSGDVIWFGTGF